MVALTHETLRAAADAAREHSRSLRERAAAQRLELRRTRAAAEQRRSRLAQTSQRVDRTRSLEYRSPWSDLSWRMVGTDLEHVLVPHDGEI